MGLPGRDEFRNAMLRYVEIPGAKLFHALKFTPNNITILGFVITVISAYLVGAGWLLAGGIVFLFAGVLDLMDGGLARLTGQASPFGALMDSVFDRLSEASIFVGIAVFALRSEISDDRQMFFMTVLLLALIFSQGVSYLRARGEGLGVFTKAGLMTRPERVLLLGVGLIVEQIEWMLLVIAVVSCLTLFQRLFTIRAILDKTG